jgi:hypothetical protein
MEHATDLEAFIADPLAMITRVNSTDSTLTVYLAITHYRPANSALPELLHVQAPISLAKHPEQSRSPAHEVKQREQFFLRHFMQTPNPMYEFRA